MTECFLYSHRLLIFYSMTQCIKRNNLYSHNTKTKRTRFEFNEIKKTQYKSKLRYVTLTIMGDIEEGKRVGDGRLPPHPHDSILEASDKRTYNCILWSILCISFIGILTFVIYSIVANWSNSKSNDGSCASCYFSP